MAIFGIAGSAYAQSFEGTGNNLGAGGWLTNLGDFKALATTSEEAIARMRTVDTMAREQFRWRMEQTVVSRTASAATTQTSTFIHLHLMPWEIKDSQFELLPSSRSVGI